MKKTRKKLMLVYVVLIALVLGVNHMTMSPVPVPQEQGSSAEFIADNAIAHIRQIAEKPRPVGSAYLGEVRDYIKSHIDEQGLDVKEEVHSLYSDREGKQVKIHNLTTRIKGTDSTGDIMVMAHYDSYKESPGANDNGANVSIMLEMIELLQKSEPLKNDIVFFFTDGEELGGLGSKEFVKQNVLDNVELVINLEARGSKGKSLLFETSPGNAGLMKEFLEATSKPYAYSFANDFTELMALFGTYTDYTPFKEKGVAGLNLAYLGGSEVYDNKHDTIESLTPSSIQHNGLYGMELVNHFGNLNLDRVSENDGNANYFNLFGYHVVQYSQDLDVWISLLAILSGLFALRVSTRRNHSTIRKSLVWPLTILSAMLAIVVVVSTLVLIIAQIQLGNPLFAVLGGILAVMLLVTIGWFLVKNDKWKRYMQRMKAMTMWDVVNGSLILLALFTVVSLFATNMNYLFAWPLLLSSMSIVIYVTSRPQSVFGFIWSLTISIPITLLLFGFFSFMVYLPGLLSYPIIFLGALIYAPTLWPSFMLRHSEKIH
ncbi:M28 family peptidase [Exiguobacterium sp. s162]|uniref:M28 family peptidase n=1 Tax=Exiguobacterium sp. s162 TaxID=2751276 RepID=UPI001BE93834|nr:M28 family peptidase [Exiguobacterium sp. s162]